VNLHVSRKNFDGGLARSRPSEALIKPPNSVVLGDWKSAQRAVKGSSSLGDERLLEEEGQVHFPDARHLVEQDQSSFEEGIYLLVFGAIYRRVAPL
jgi:hypothetical protein